MDDSVAAAVWGPIAIGAIAALGYLGKLIADFVQTTFRKRQADTARLVELRSLLRATYAIYKSQNEKSKQLFDMLRYKHYFIKLPEGYERTFAKLYQVMNDEEKTDTP